MIYKLRKCLASLLIKTGLKLIPANAYKNKDHKKEFELAYMDAMVYGRGVIKIQHVPMNPEASGEGKQ